jgi:beta-barrel assembly-enhancing protease
MLRSQKIRVSFACFAAALLMLSPAALLAQTRVSMPKNRYKVQDDIQLGAQAAQQVEQQFPLLNDSQVQNYVATVGERLVASIPPEFRQPAFDYRFRVVNASDLNAFALPGGPMYVNRGMIEAASNEGEMAGVMAHEISHVALRHATAQQTKLRSPLNQILGIGAVLGGAVVGGQTGAAIGQTIAAGYFLRYSRDYETQADIVGSRIMADAGYDPRDLANMFRTIAQQGGSRGPEWLSSHPDPGNRYERINREAQALRVSPNAVRSTREFSRIQERLRSMPPAPTMAEIQRNPRAGGTTNPTAGGRYSRQVPYPSSQTRVFSGGGIRVDVPANWREFGGSGTLIFSPEGSYGDQGITHGAMIGIHRSGGADVLRASQDYLSSVLSANPNLRQRDQLTPRNIAGRRGYATTLSGRSPVTNDTEVVAVFTVPLRTGDILYLAAVVPEVEFSRYSSAFQRMVSSLRISD